MIPSYNNSFITYTRNVHPHYLHSGRFKETSAFDSATHVVGVIDFMILKQLELVWSKEVRSWKKITSGELNEVRPTIGQRKTSKDTTSPTKMKHRFI